MCVARTAFRAVGRAFGLFRPRGDAGGGIGDITRFANPRQFVAYLGLVPSPSTQRKHATPGRNHQGGQWRGAAHVDRGGIELPVSSTYRSRSPFAPRKVEQANPRHSLEGPGATLPSISRSVQRMCAHGLQPDRVRLLVALVGKAV
jgi:hypothetical protein